MFCSKCGKPLVDNSKFCSACGTPVSLIQEEKPQIKKGQQNCLYFGKWVCVILVIAAGTFLWNRMPKPDSTLAVIEDTEDKINVESKQTSDEKIASEDKTSSDIKTTADEKLTTEELETEQSNPDMDDENAFLKAKIRAKYADMVATMSDGGHMPLDDSGEYYDFLPSYANEYNEYAIIDIDGDGVEELLVSIASGCMAEYAFLIYDYEKMQEPGYQPDYFFPSPDFYENGILIDYASHNQSPGEYVWPYSIYQYNSATDHYDYIGSVSSWTKELNSDGFPDDKDTDGDGNVVYIDMDNQETVCIDSSEYADWYTANITNGLDVIPVSYSKLESSSCIPYIHAYRDAILKRIRKDNKNTIEDIGELYWETDGDLNVVKNYIQNFLGISFSEYDTDYLESVGISDGIECILLSQMDIGSITYQEYVEGLTLFGIYPGMNESDAYAAIEKYGFEEQMENFYITGLAYPRVGISMSINNGIVETIDIFVGSNFAG